MNAKNSAKDVPAVTSAEAFSGRRAFLTVLRRPAALTTASVFLLLLASDWVPATHRFWQQRSMTTNVVSSLVFIFFTLWIVEDLLDASVALRSQRAKRAAHRALAEAVLESRLRVTVSVDGFDLRLRTINPPLPDAGAIAGALSRNSCEPHNAVPVAPFPEDDLQRWTERFGLIATDRDWCAIVLDAVRYSKALVWDEIAAWAPVMLADRESAAILNEVARLADCLLAAEQSVTDVFFNRETEVAGLMVERLMTAVERSPDIIDALAPGAGWRGRARRTVEPRRDPNAAPN